MNAAFPLMGNSGAASSTAASKSKVTTEGAAKSGADASTLANESEQAQFLLWQEPCPP